MEAALCCRKPADGGFVGQNQRSEPAADDRTTLYSSLLRFPAAALFSLDMIFPILSQQGDFWLKSTKTEWHETTSDFYNFIFLFCLNRLQICTFYGPLTLPGSRPHHTFKNQWWLKIKASTFQTSVLIRASIKICRRLVWLVKQVVSDISSLISWALINSTVVRIWLIYWASTGANQLQLHCRGATNQQLPLWSVWFLLSSLTLTPSSKDFGVHVFTALLKSLQVRNWC